MAASPGRQLKYRMVIHLLVHWVVFKDLESFTLSDSAIADVKRTRLGKEVEHRN